MLDRPKVYWAVCAVYPYIGWRLAQSQWFRHKHVLPYKIWVAGTWYSLRDHFMGKCLTAEVTRQLLKSHSKAWCSVQSGLQGSHHWCMSGWGRSISVDAFVLELWKYFGYVIKVCQCDRNDVIWTSVENASSPMQHEKVFDQGAPFVDQCLSAWSDCVPSKEDARLFVCVVDDQFTEYVKMRFHQCRLARCELDVEESLPALWHSQSTPHRRPQWNFCEAVRCKTILVRLGYHNAVDSFVRPLLVHTMPLVRGMHEAFLLRKAMRCAGGIWQLSRPDKTLETMGPRKQNVWHQKCYCLHWIRARKYIIISNKNVASFKNRLWGTNVRCS